MGALIMIRDEPGDAPIPEKFEPSDYAAKRLAETETRLQWLNGLTPQQCLEEATKAYEEEREGHRTYAAKKEALRKKYRAMLTAVNGWVPPTPDHQGLKDFMVEQITSSIKFDCHDSYEREPLPPTGREWRTVEVAKCMKDIEYHTKSNAEELTRTAQRNQWIADLRNSLGSEHAKACGETEKQ
jgi:hypothetical protein